MDMILFENFNEIQSICDEYGIRKYTINQDGSIDVDDHVDLRDKNLSKLPLKFNKVSGYFSCSYNELTSLEGSPREVGGSFYCYNNQLTSLKGGPKEVYIDFYCNKNQLTSLKGGPEKVGRDFYCADNQLINLEGLPEKVFYIGCIGNPIFEIFKLFKDYNEFKELLEDYNYLRGTRIIKARFEQACLDARIKIPTEINGYEII